MSGIYGLKFPIFPSKAIDVMVEDIGQPSGKNLPIFADRKNMYGVEHIDENDLNDSVQRLNPLTNKIIRRKSTQIFINKDVYNYNILAESLLELFRYHSIVCNDKFRLNDIQPTKHLKECSNRKVLVFYLEKKILLLTV